MRLSKKTKFIVQKKQKTLLILNDINSLKSEIKFLKPTKIFFFYDPAVKNHLSKYVLKSIETKWIPLILNEAKKNISEIIKILEILETNGADRKSLVVSMGGGIQGDMIGFASQIYLRGLPWVSIPTTVLSQVDSGIGGKNGINFLNGKNRIGTVYQPVVTYFDPDVLKSLPEKELKSGMGEILKYYFLSKQIKNLKTFKWDSNLSNFIFECAKFKMSLVVKDPEDLFHIRAKLNLGHTFGHAIEKFYDYKKYSHGEAVTIGLGFALAMSAVKKTISIFEFKNHMEVLKPFLPKKLSLPSAKQAYLLSLKDKKSINNQVQMVLIKKRGEVIFPVSVSLSDYLKAYDYLKEESFI